MITRSDSCAALPAHRQDRSAMYDDRPGRGILRACAAVPDPTDARAVFSAGHRQCGTVRPVKVKCASRFHFDAGGDVALISLQDHIPFYHQVDRRTVRNFDC